jgi:glycosyltransferase involved in cell wall biosynthesis
MRLVVVSARRLGLHVNWTTLGPPLEDSLGQMPGATVVHAPEVRRGTLRAERPAWLEAIRTMRRADAVFWMQMSSRPPLPVWALAYAKPSAKRAAVTVDAWQPAVEKIASVARAQRLSVLFVFFREAAVELSRRYHGTRFEWLPFGYDASAFRDLGLERDIFAYWMGRRYEPLHRSLEAYCLERGLDYRYTKQGGEFPDPHDLNRVIARSRYFVVTPPNLDNPERTGGYSPMMMRYLEGLGSGARLLGVLPNQAEYELMLPKTAVVRCAPDGSDLAEVLDRDAADPQTEEKRRYACARVVNEHRWERRAETIHTRLSELVSTGGTVSEPVALTAS